MSSKNLFDLWSSAKYDHVIDSKLNKTKVSDLKTKKFIGVYFSAHWCPPCRHFTPLLDEVYRNAVRQNKDSFEILFVSSDGDQDEFNHYFELMSWKALPFDDRNFKEIIASEFNIRGIPSLLLFNGSGDLVEYNGRDVVMNSEKMSELLGINPKAENKEHIVSANETMLSLGLTEEQINQLNSWVFEMSAERVTRPKLKYVASIDGFSWREFYRTCVNDPVKRLLLLVKTKAGFIFGAFTDESFDSEFQDKADPKSFLFSLVNPHGISVMLKPHKNMSAGPGWAPDRGQGYGAVNGYGDLALRDRSNFTGGWSMLGKVGAGYEDTTGKGGSLFSGGVPDERKQGEVPIGPIEEILGIQV